MEATCRKCNKKITDPNKWNGSFNGCKPCRNIYLRELRIKNPQYKIKAKARYRANAIHHRFKNKQLEVPEDWETMKKDACEICGDGLTEETLRIDHSHTTGAFRGVLCSRCNSGLGFFKDSSDVLEKAAEYARRGL